MRSIEEIKAELREAEAAARLEEERRRAETPVIWKYTIYPADETIRRNDYVYDDSCTLFVIKGEVVNKEEAKAAGHYFTLDGGRMVYVFNKLSGKLVMGVGGGTIFVGPSWGREDDGADRVAMDEISAFVREYPEGGDITHIINVYNRVRGHKY